ncbi:uncharacterized protein LOC106459747 [Limulus polyphemus]|uniref:Uncharacterized protein LOC106459747 n=1 Tax=Limulus polyphemus TaxID=6850 RepID=A0ABM1SED8_LIMPO|nr:uncharacterized protein LOC106459747 [Limulus polyphemus]
MADEQLEGLSAGKHVKDFPELNLPDIPDLPVLQVLQGTTMTEASTVKSGLSVKGTASPPQELSDFVKPIMVPTQAGALKSENLAKNIVVQNGKSPLKAKKESMRDLDPIELPKGNHLQTHVRTRSTSRELKTEMYINSQLAAPQPTDSKSKKPYDKLLEKLNTKYPQISQTDLTTYIKTFRAQKKGLTGMSCMEI